ncbi:MAG: ABC transporter permease [Archaeoglobales archaeon]|nr:ABC transporter permease [Archaeoglobales archaeon]
MILKILTVAVFAFLYVPIIYLVFSSFYDDGFTFRNYEAILNDRNVTTAFFNSLNVAILSTLISVILGTLAAYSFKKRGHFLESLFYPPIVIPEITEAVALLLFFKMLEFPLGYYSVLTGHIAFNVAFVYVVVYARASSIEKSIEEASYTLGANEFQTFTKVVLPLLMPGIVAASLIAFTLSWDNFIKTAFTTGPGFNTLPLLIWSQAARGVVSPSINALASLMLLISIVLSYLYVRISIREE